MPASLMVASQSPLSPSPSTGPALYDPGPEHATGGGPNPLQSLLAAYPRGCLLLRDTLETPGHFLLPWITAGSIRQGHKVVVLAAAYSPAQHTAALRKLGAMTSSSTAATQPATDTGPVRFVSPAAAARAAAATAATAAAVTTAAAAAAAGGTSSTSNSSDRQPVPCCNLPRLQQLYCNVLAAARHLLACQPLPPPPKQQQQQQVQSLTVVLDSLACLSALAGGGNAAAGGGQSQMQALLHQLVALGEVLQVPYRLVLLAARDIPAQHTLLLHAASVAHVTADINPLEGRPAALDGSMCVVVRRVPLSTSKRGGDAATATLAGASNGGSRSSSSHPGWLHPGSSSTWFFRCGDVGVKWLSEVHGKELMA